LPEEKTMNINLHIERLILDGLPIESRQGTLVKEAVEAELMRLLEQNGLSANLQAGGAFPSLQTQSVNLTAEKNPALSGEQIAQAVYGRIGNEGVKK
jgi:biotin operon repressor